MFYLFVLLFSFPLRSFLVGGVLEEWVWRKCLPRSMRLEKPFLDEGWKQSFVSEREVENWEFSI